MVALKTRLDGQIIDACGIGLNENYTNKSIPHSINFNIH